jgi:mono/diheme cytochrome c family protein
VPRTSFVVLFVAAWMAVALPSGHTSAQQTQSRAAPVVAAPPAGLDTTRAALGRYCIACHNQKLLTAGLALDTVDVAKPSVSAAVWERVILKLRGGVMPPPGSPRPDDATYDSVSRWLETEIDRSAAASPNPGRNSTVHRLNRAEYHNAIRDLFAVDIDVKALLPGDETSDRGFDNNADVLSLTTTQLERYMSAARKITRLATGLPPTGAGFETFEVPLLLLQDDRQNEDLPLGSRGGAVVRYNFPVDGEYLIKVHLRTNWQDYILGMGTPHQLDIRIDGALVKRFTVGGDARGRPSPAGFAIAEPGEPAWEEYIHHADDQLEVRLPIKAGPRAVGLSFVRKMLEPEGILQPRQGGRVLSQSVEYDGNAAVGSVAIGGPYRVDGPGNTPSRRGIFVCEPVRGAEEEGCATKILSRVARRAFRRPVTARDVQVLLGFFKDGRASGGSFDAGIQLALERLLVDPDFLLRIEREPNNVSPGRVYRLSDLEVASRLSFFLWSSIPDEPLLDVAERGKLTDPLMLEQQVRRMLADVRSQALVDNFAAQWLHLRNLEDVLGDPVPFPDFDLNLVEAFRTETELFIASTLHEDRSVLDLLSANYTFVNERLAQHYGIPGVYGSRFRRVTLPDREQRGGLLAHGGLLALTSYPTRTSPVLRGKWLLDTILGAPPPQPPPDVPDLPERGQGGKTVSVRERLEQHRQNPACASCHSTIDPLGFALENYDALGAWRTLDEGGGVVDAAGTMRSGAKVEGLRGLRALLLNKREQFVRTVTEKLVAYAVGRELEYYDQPTVRKVAQDAAPREYRWSSLILGVVRSPAFLMRRSHAAE